MWLPQPKYWLWMRSGATIRSISSCSLVLSQVGIRPSVSPLCGSVSIAGMGMNGAVAGSSQRMSPDGAGAGAAGAGGAAAVSAPPAPRAVASSASAHTVHQPVDLRRDLDTLASALRVPSIGALDTGGSEPRRGPSRLMVSLVHRLVPHPAARDGGYNVTEWSAPNAAKVLRGAPRRDPWSLYTILAIRPPSPSPSPSACRSARR